MRETITIILEIPHKSLSQNKPSSTFGGRMGKAREVKKYRLSALKAIEQQGVSGWQKAELHASFYYKTKRRRDSLNSMGMLKGAIDGVIDAGLLPDDDSEHLIPLAPSICLDTYAPRVELTFTRLD